MNYDDYIREAIADAESLAHGRQFAAQIPCPKCQRPDSLSVRTTVHGKAYMGTCSTAGCIRWHYPERSGRSAAFLPQEKLPL